MSGHNLLNLPRTAEHRANIGKAQTLVWQTKRQRLPVGSLYVDSDGYIRVKVEPGKGKWILQHTLVMQEHLGRPLTSTEVVHHINGVRTDNRLENLFLCHDRSEHNRIEGSLVEVFRELLAAGVVRFNREQRRYETVL